MALLSIKNLCLSIYGSSILKDISLEIEAGKILGIVGESGSGKSLTALSIMQLLPNGSTLDGSINLDGQPISSFTEKQLCALRGNDMSMIFQEPMTALNPLKTIGDQVCEAIMIHTSKSRRQAEEIARETLNRVELPEDRFPLSRYPHDLSGGQRQRVMIAMAIALRPKILLADEPTTALDVTTQAQILDLLRRLVREDQMSLILITHDLAVVSDMADHVAIMKNGRIVEAKKTRDLFEKMDHPYTRQLFSASQHTPDKPPASSEQKQALLTVDNLVRDYTSKSGVFFGKSKTLRAVDHVSFNIFAGENVGLVGESGCGKSTLSRALLALDKVQGGKIILKGQGFSAAGKGPTKKQRAQIQVVFQDPYGSFNPRHKVGRLITESFHLLDQQPSKLEKQNLLNSILIDVGLVPEDAHKYIHEFSGGQRQRIAIARAIITHPSLVILDEAVSALDVSVRAQILDLLSDLSIQKSISYLFISHDLSVVKKITNRVMVMKDGQIIETGDTKSVFENPKTDYTKQLIKAAPDLEFLLHNTQRKRTAKYSNSPS